VLYICIPAFDEAPTVGVLLWRIRKVFQEYAREYEVLVHDDASTDATRDVLAPYTKAMPVTVLGGAQRVGYARSVDALLREASRRTRYPRRDAVVLLQADFTDQPEALPELVKRFEGGADIVVGERTLPADAPDAVRRMHRLASWLPRVWPIRHAVTVPGVRDPFGSYLLMRVTVVRELLRLSGDLPFSKAEAPWQANLDLLRDAATQARRLEAVPVTARFDVRQRATRRDPWPDAWGLLRAAWANRARPPRTQPTS
jgi:glycosyltransferase involved in cell wall biosynthesis